MLVKNVATSFCLQPNLLLRIKLFFITLSCLRVLPLLGLLFPEARMGLTIARQDYLFVQLYKAYTRWSIRNPKRRALLIPCFASYPKVLKASPAIDIP